MKKIMKKALSLALALVMMLSLAPMTAMAMITYGDGTQESPYLLSGTADQLTVEANTTLYYGMQMADTAQYQLKVTGAAGFIAKGYNSDFSAIESKGDVNGEAFVTVQGFKGTRGVAYFSIENTTNEVQQYMVELQMPEGTEGNPKVVVMGENVADCSTSGMYHYTWTATEAGAFTLTLTEETLNACDWEVMFKYVERADGTYSYPDGHWKGEEPEVTSMAFNVQAGDVVEFVVTDYNWGTMKFNVELGELLDPTPIPNPDPLPGEEEEEGPNYEWGDAIVVGENALAGPQDWTHFYTVHEFAPGKVGVYTFTTEDSLMGIVSTNGMWINVGNPGEEYDPDNVPELMITEKEIVWECTAVEQSIWLGVFPEMLDSNITVTWEELVVEEIPSTNVLPSVSLETYSFKGELDNLNKLMYDMADGKVTIYGDDNGYYHVVAIDDVDDDGNYVGKKPLADCPLALVKLNDSVLSLASAIGYGSVKYVEYDNSGENPVATHITYFNDMITEYLACAATDEKLYPLTDDLGDIMYYAGIDQGWYEETGVVYEAYKKDKIPAEALMFFAMYYLDQDIVTLDKEEPVVDKEAMTDIIANNKDKDTVIDTVVKNEAGEEVKVTFTFAANTMKPIEGKEEYTFAVELVETFDKAELEKVDVKKEAFVLKVNFEYDGKLPGEATIYIPVPATYINKTLYYYQVLADGTLEYVCDAPVDGAGNAKVTQDHCSDYVLLTEKIVEEAPEKSPAEAPDTGDSTNFILWIAVLGLGVVAIAGSVVMKKREF